LDNISFHAVESTSVTGALTLSYSDTTTDLIAQAGRESSEITGSAGCKSFSFSETGMMSSYRASLASVGNTQ
jgi:hypothetical protein